MNFREFLTSRNYLEIPDRPRSGCSEWRKQGENVRSRPLESLNTGDQEPSKLFSRRFITTKFVNKALLVCLLILLWRRIGEQPQRDVGRLHSLPYHPHKRGVQRIQICLISELSREGF